jgi:adenylate cyclase
LVVLALVGANPKIADHSKALYDALQKRGENPVAREQRRLAAIVAADVVGYSRLMGRDESGTLARLRKNRSERLDPVLKKYGGRLVKLTGDGALVEFASAVDALSAAIEFQQAMADANGDQPAEAALVFRMGLHLGDLIVDGDDLYGDGVNIAARLEAEAPAGGVVISRTVHEAVRGRLKANFEDLGRLALKNIDRPVQAFSVKWEPADWQLPMTSATTAASTTAPQVPLPLPDKPSIAVLPFQNMSGDPEQEYFADGMVEEIITALSRIRWLFVIARTSSFTYKGKTLDIKQIGRELGVRYLLEGSVRKAGRLVRITGQLIDAQNGAHLWADHFDVSIEEIFELQDKVAISVAGVIEPTLVAAEIRRIAERPTQDPTAYDLFLRALFQSFAWNRKGVEASLLLLGQAIARDPHYGPALAQVARCHQDLHVNGWTDDPQGAQRTAIQSAHSALQASEEDPFVLAAAAYTLAYFGEPIAPNLELIDRALALNPSYARGWVVSGWLRLWAGEPELAMTHLEKALRLSPRARTTGTLMAIGVAHFFARRFEDATVMLLRSLQEHPDWAPTYRFLASCYAYMGRLDDAREVMKRLRNLTDVVVPDPVHWRKAEYREFYISGLRMAAEL